ncbi:hypothetical protein FB566_0086 [Stackebrandtia endophytica]|uniref:N-acetyltransferase domain-containing protein n=1 Tax=Stackebrandtia endophytica TaxID=1496996 RepID=A0A543APU3_9ACTN|nr:GNAT family N-acetyltransferase [Stackebrandtia endophytica]TQL74600.1 hypothetical protein FB566_0086 [Stackebrandtia endophytica]
MRFDTGVEAVASRQARNSAAYWAATGRSRGHRVVERDGFLAVVGDVRAGTRVLIQRPDLSRREVTEIRALFDDAAGPFDVEDPFSVTDLIDTGMRSWQMPIMVRAAGPVDPPQLDVVRVADEAGLAAAERVVISGFELSRFEPHRPGEMFPVALLEEPGVAVFIAIIEDAVAGACVTVEDDGVGSHYWVGTPAGLRSRGVGRAVMLGSLAPLSRVPVTLTASRLGRPLYESLGYVAATDSTWWSSS